MKHLLWFTSFVVSLSLSAAAAVHVTVSSPVNNSQVTSPFHEIANATSSYPIVGWHIYLDSNDVYTGGRTGSINATINAAVGRHQLVTRAWDSTGAYGDETETITVTSGGNGGNNGGGGNGLPTPPAGAIVYHNIQNNGGWGYCNAPSCAGGDGDGAYWMAQHQSTPSRSGSSTEFYNSGVWDNALWFQKLGANNNVHNLLWDFYFYVDSNSQHATQALEFDSFQFVNGYNYMIGSQCDYGQSKWDTWDEASGHWIATSLACPKFSPNTWHHIQWYVTTNTSTHQYTYVTLVVDGTVHPINTTRNAKYLAWGNNLGVQWQLDCNASGEDYHEWIDQSTLSIW